MRQSGRGLRLGPDHVLRVPVRRQLGGENLDRHLPPEPFVVGPPDNGPATAAEALHEAVPTPEYLNCLHVPNPALIDVDPTIPDRSCYVTISCSLSAEK